MHYWLMKSEPSTFSIDDLVACSQQTEPWTGVRNYQVRNFLRDEIKRNDLAFFYHSSCEVPGIVGIVKVISDGYPDASAFDPNSHYYDSTSCADEPRWYCVDVQLVKKFQHIISLAELRKNPKLKNMLLLQKGNRLSITPVTQAQWEAILATL